LVVSVMPVPSRVKSIASSTARKAWLLPTAAAFPLLGVLFFTFFAAASAPSPLFVIFQQQWGFSSALLTVAFAIYAIALLASLLVAGSLSDHIGRRPVIFAALMLQATAMLVFMLSTGIGGIIAARIVQGVATGMVSGALTAAIVESAPVSRKHLGAMISSMSPLAGLAVGALLTGIAVATAGHPIPLVFGSLATLCVAGAIAVIFMPETVTPRPGALASLVPRIAVPPAARAVFMRGLTVSFGIWAMAGLFLSLVPSLMQQVFGIHSGIVNGAVIAVLFGVGSAAPSFLRSRTPAAVAAIGPAFSAAGAMLLLTSLSLGMPWLFFTGAAVAGFGSGGAFSAQVQLLAPLARDNERAELFAALYVVSYLSFSVPAMVAGQLIAHIGLRVTVEGYLLMLAGVASISVMMQRSALRKTAGI
jgi:MFS family permease